MAQYELRFFFADLDETRRHCEVRVAAGHLGKALSRAWLAVKEKTEYKGIKGLRPSNIEIAPSRKMTEKEKVYTFMPKVKVGA